MFNMKHFIILCNITLTIAKVASIQQNVRSLYENIDKGLGVLCLKANISVEVSKDLVSDSNVKIIESIGEEIQKINRQVSVFFKELNYTFYALEVRPTNPNMIECGQVREVHRMNIIDLQEDTINCVKQKRTDSAGLMKKIDDIWRGTLFHIAGLKFKASECVGNIDGFKNATRAIYCLEKVRRIANFVYHKRMTELEKIRNELIFLADGIGYSLAFCSVTSGLGDLISSTFISDNMRNCFEQVKDSPNDIEIQIDGRSSEAQSVNHNPSSHYSWI